jgi:hypothetical protein
VRKRRLDLIGHALGVARARADPGQVRQLLLGAAAGAGRLLGILVAERIEAEAATFGDLDRAFDRLGSAPEQARHLGRFLQVALGVGRQAKAGRVDGAVLAHAGERVQERPARGHVHAHVVGRNQRGTAGRGAFGQMLEAPRIVAAVEHLAGQIAGAGKAPAEPGKRLLKRGIGVLGRQDDEHLAFAVVFQLRQGEATIALLGAALAECQQAAEAAVGGPVARIAQHLGTVLGHQARADQQLEARLLGSRVGAHHAGQGVAVGDAQRGQAQRLGGEHQLVRMRAAAQEAVVAGHLQLGISGHGGGHGGKSVRWRTRGTNGVPATASHNCLSAVTSVVSHVSAQAT